MIYKQICTHTGSLCLSVQGMYTYQASVIRVTDGDTLRFLIDMGMYIRTEQAIRLLNVYAPELHTDEGKIAQKHTADWVEAHGHGQVWPFAITTKKDKQTFTRYIGEVICFQCSSSLNEHLRSLGYTDQGTGAPK